MNNYNIHIYYNCPNCKALNLKKKTVCTDCGKPSYIAKLNVIRGLLKGNSYLLYPFTMSLGHSGNSDIVISLASFENNHCSLLYDSKDGKYFFLNISQHSEVILNGSLIRKGTQPCLNNKDILVMEGNEFQIEYISISKIGGRWTLDETLINLKKFQYLAKCTSFDMLLKEGLSVLLDISGLERGYAFKTIISEGNILELKEIVAVDSSGNKINEIDFSISQTVLNIAVKSEGTILIEDTSDKLYSNSESVCLYDIRTVICIPLIFNKNLEGVLYCDFLSLTKKLPPHIRQMAKLLKVILNENLEYLK